MQQRDTDGSLRSFARAQFLHSLERVSIPVALYNQLHVAAGSLQMCDLTFNTAAFQDVLVVAIGKAAGPMCDEVLEQMIQDPSLYVKVRCVVVSSTIPVTCNPRVIHIPGSHPLPDDNALRAAEVLLRELGKCNADSLVLFLVSGGSSAMVEMPLDPSFTVSDLVLFHRTLVGSGLPIAQMNALRKHFSRVKGGRLAVAAGDATQCTLLISDVPEDMLHTVGSGPSLPDPSTITECRALLAEHAHILGLTDSMKAFFRSPALPETPKPSHPSFRNAHWRSLLSSRDLSEQAALFAKENGFKVEVDNTCDDWDYREAAHYLVERMIALRHQHPRVCLITVGEVSVRLPRAHGVGGRNQQFVLECARVFHERQLPFTVLSGGSDGVDGTSSAAGAVGDASTVMRAARLGHDVVASLERFDSFPLFQALDDSIVTGPTGTNVRDLRVLLSTE